MCRHAIYLGKEIYLNQLVVDPEHSLLKQSYEPKELQEAKINADGYGVGWITKDGQTGKYLNSSPIWSDINLPYIGNAIKAPLIIANVRSATIGSGYGPENLHPFLEDNFLFSHNGYIEGFYGSVGFELKRVLKENIAVTIKGNTDSEIIFALIRQNISEGLHVKNAVIKTIEFLKKISNGRKALLNIFIAHKENDRFSAYITRYAIGSEPPSLYYNLESSFKGINNGIVVASEKLDHNTWKKIKSGQFITIQDKVLKTENL